MTAKIALSEKDALTEKSDVLVLCLQNAEDVNSKALQGVDGALGKSLLSYLKEVDFDVDKGGLADVPSLGRLAARHVVVTGARASLASGPALVEAVAQGVRQALSHRPEKISVLVVGEANVEASAVGALLGGYRFDRYLTDKKYPELKAVSLHLSRAITAEDKKALSRGIRIGQGVCLGRDLVNEPPNRLYPETFAAEARKVAKKHGLACKILDEQQIVKAGMLLHDAVGRGSRQGPRFIHLTYKPKKKAKGSLVFVGKGITFDTGGICIKPAPSMEEMKSDMGGGAAVLGLMEAISALELDIEVHGIIAAAENMPDGNAYRPADVIPSLSGKTVEIINTDAEGRLVLADALTYAARLKPDMIVDAATLTGATLVSLGAPYSAFFTATEEIASAMTAASAAAGESFWRMPLIEELRAQLRSDVADLKHTGERWGGAITAALFLQEFTDQVPWMHCDIPGPTFRNRATGMHPKGGTGHAVLTFLELARRHAAEPIVQASSGSSKTSPKKSAPKSSEKAAVTSGPASTTAASKKSGTRRGALSVARKMPTAQPRRRKTEASAKKPGSRSK